MITLAVHHGPHDSSVALLDNEKVIFHLQGERLSNIKYDHNAVQVLNYVKKYTDRVDNLVLTGASEEFSIPGLPTYYPDVYYSYLKSMTRDFYKSNIKVYKYFHNHHEIHAATAFYNSGFDEAACLVIDGMGSLFYNTYSDDGLYINNIHGRETKSSFVMSYPNNINLIEKHITITGLPNSIDRLWIDDKTYITKSFSEGMLYEMFAGKLGFTQRDSGKVMGMAPYGIPNKWNHPFYINGLTNKFLYEHYGDESCTYLGPTIGETFQEKADLAYKLQKDVEESVLQQAIDLINKTGQKNLCLSGGFFLNCVSNYNLLKKLPSDINIYVEPMCSDIGNSVGAGKFLYYSLTKSKQKNPQTKIYYGPKHSYTESDLVNEKIIKNVDAAFVADLIAKKNIVAIYQGSSESGPRALGNRSILYDPRDPNGKDHVNIVKKREWFRPFAGSVLKEKAKEWFDLHSMEESKFMMYAVDVLPSKIEQIPAITHVDGTCRVQTVSIDDNEYFYNLINEFNNITGVPILFNTSFNLAGDTIVETLDDALRTLHGSEINYLYLPELKVIVTK